MSQEDGDNEDGQVPDKDKPEPAGSGNGDGQNDDEIKKLREDAKKAREEAEAAKTQAAKEKADLAEEKARLAEEKAKAAASAKDDKGGKTYDEEFVKKLKDEAAGYRVEAREAKREAQEREDQNKSEQQRTTERAVSAEARADQAEKRLMRYEVAQKKKLPTEMADRLVGDTKEELEKDADKLVKQFNSGLAASGGSGLDQGDRSGGGPGSGGGSSRSDWIRDLAGRRR